VASIPYPALFGLTAEAGKKGLRHEARSLFLKSPDRGALAALIDVAPTFVSLESFIGLVPLGGAIGRVPASATAFAHRDASLWVFGNAAGLDASGDGRRRALVDHFWQAMQPYSTGAYVNTLSHDEAHRTGDAYPPATHARLAALKRRYDPTNVFRHNQNVEPAR
jgi:FAD/FMN-containing dehydrogenase